MSEPKAVVFDLDGTLLNTLDDLTAAVNFALESCGYSAFDSARVRRYVGNGVRKLIARSLHFAYTGSEPPEDIAEPPEFDRCLAFFTRFYDAHNADRTAPYPGIPEMIEEICSAGYRTAIVTNKYDGAAQALKVKFFPAVELAIGVTDGIRPKPAPDGVEKALRILGVKKSRAVYVGDGETDIATAKATGLPVIAVGWGFRDKEVLTALDPDLIIDSPRELANAVNRIFTSREIRTGK